MPEKESDEQPRRLSLVEQKNIITKQTGWESPWTDEELMELEAKGETNFGKLMRAYGQEQELKRLDEVRRRDKK